MHPLFGSNDLDGRRKRQINLGGLSSNASQTALLEQAKTRREERDAQKRRAEAAVRVQAWWRGESEGKRVRNGLKQVLRDDTKGINGLRALVLIGRDEDALALWSSSMDQAALFSPLRGSDAQSWRTLLPRAALLLLHSVANHPSSSNSAAQLRILTTLTSATSTTSMLGPEDQLSTNITAHLLQHGLILLITQAISHVPIPQKAAPELPSLISIALVPLTIFGPTSSTPSETLYITTLVQILTQLLSIPLLPNRLPLPSLTLLSKSIPYTAFPHVLPLVVSKLKEINVLHRVHILANLLAFVPPRYTVLPARSMTAYLALLAELLSGVAPNAFEPESKQKVALETATWIVDSDDEDAPIRVERVTTFANTLVPAPLPPLDAKTLARLAILPSAPHMRSLVTVAKGDGRPALATLILALNAAWPARKTRVLSSVLAHAGGSLLRELYRGWVRGSPVGRDESGNALFDDKTATVWPPLLLLVELYTHALLTMHDDEFFSSDHGHGHGSSAFTLSAATAPAAAGATSDAAAAARNPLSLDELTSLSRQLLNIVFPLYWRDDAGEAGARMAAAPVPGVPGLSWVGARERITACLQAIHLRDSRKRFTPADHWIVTSEIDIELFVQAALFEAEQLEDEGEGMDLPASRQPARNTRNGLMRRTAAFGPRLGVLNNIPFAVPFEVRVAVFRGWVAKDMQKISGAGDQPFSLRPQDRFRRFWGDNRPKVHAVVRRGHIAQDGFDKLGDVDLKAPIAITFIDQFGNEEAGIDGGGVFKEFFTSLCKEVFDTDRGLWLSNKVNELYPNPHGYATESHSLNWYRFIGRILGKAMYEGILVEVAFAPFFLAKWLGRQSFLDDLASLDPALYQGLIFLKHYTGDPEELGLNFTAAVEEFGDVRTIDLLPDGANIPVTRENRLQYIYLIAHFRLTRQIRAQSAAFFEGLSEVVDPRWLRMFNQQELQILLGGVDAPVDIEDLHANTTYGGLYDTENMTIMTFWRVVASFNQEERRQLLKFVTSCSRPPLLGFKELYPQFSIRDAGGDEARLPTASTCVNLLKLPRYSNEQIMRSKLLQAISSNAGFDLS